MNKYKSIRRSILDALVENENGFMPVQEIAEVALGPFPNSAFKRLGINQVKRNIGHAIELAASNDLMIIAKKAPTKIDSSKNFRIVGYKVADESDEKWVKEAIESKADKVQEYSNSYNLFASRLVENKLIEPSDLLKLNS